jgi:hypothetical protein
MVLAATVACLGPGLSQAEAPAFSFAANPTISVDPMVHKQFSSTHGYADRGSVELSWSDGQLSVPARGVLPIEKLSLRITPEVGYDTGQETIIVLVGFTGELVTRNGSSLLIEKDNFGEFSALSLYIPELNELRITLPAALVNETPEVVRRNAFLAFRCDAQLTSCAVPSFVFERTLENYERNIQIQDLFPESAWRSKEEANHP